MVFNSSNIYALVIAATLLPSAGLHCAQPQQVQTSFSPLTREQTAVYGAFLTDYHRGSPGSPRREMIDVAETTEILQPDEGDYGGCMKGFPRVARKEVIHRLSEDFANQNHLHLVDPKLHKFQDPQDGMRNGLSVENAVESAFKSGLLTISEIIFDANHKRAAFHYSFVCGQLCAHFETVVYEKRHGVWKPSKLSCGYGVS
jgi:hypothetical protein